MPGCYYRSVMPLTTRTFTIRVVVILALVALALLLWKIAAVLMLVFAGVVLAVALRAASVPLARRTRLPSYAAVGIVLVALVGVLTGVGYLFGKPLSDEADAIWQALQQAPAQVAGFLGHSSLGQGIVDTLRGATSPETLTKVAKGTFTLFGAVADIGLVLFLAVYLAVDPATYRRGLLLLLPAVARERVDEALEASGVQLRKWLVGQLGAMVTVGVLIGVGLALLGAPLAVPLGILSALLEFVPVVGPIVALVVGVLVSFAQGPQIALYVGLLYAVVLFVEGNVIIPLAQKWAVSLPPALGLVGIVVFGVIFGLAGVLFAMPLLVVTVTLVDRLYLPAIEGAS
jgi:predicted PurR-regulated permease PerM